MLRVLFHIICALRRWQIELRRCRPENIDIAFDGDEEEAEFVRHLAPQVAKWTLVGHGVVFFMSSMTFIWNVASIHFDGSWHQIGSNAYQYHCRYTLLMLTCFGAHGLVLAALITAYYARVSAARWEFISVLTTSLFVSMLPWLDPWHGVALVGGDPDVVWGPGAEEYEALRILCLVSGVHAYALCVPIRWRYCFIVPLCCSISIIVSVCTVDSPFKASIPFKLPLMILLLLSPAVGQHYRHFHHFQSSIPYFQLTTTLKPFRTSALLIQLTRRKLWRSMTFQKPTRSHRCMRQEFRTRSRRKIPCPSTVRRCRNASIRVKSL
eukprot:TRINITY_DN10303_c0_g1_i6.p1 TRINITY_DN10303_c0_g1~~TRINITY_DN10303_c0_g1_i6.p1  ORF type:complete len:342 (+),score=17.09 TRINITY_DN10303_c0_g1_i6:59-1027(+)